MADPSSPIPLRPVLATDKARAKSRTRVLAVGVDASLVPSLLWWLPATALHVETASDFLHAVERLLGEQWDVVVVNVGDEVENDLRPWLEALEEARGRPRFIALVGQRLTSAPATSDCASTLAELEAGHITRVMRETRGRVEAAARVLGIHRNTLARKLRALESAKRGR